jgi:hypothetical protein
MEKRERIKALKTATIQALTRINKEEIEGLNLREIYPKSRGIKEEKTRAMIRATLRRKIQDYSFLIEDLILKKGAINFEGKIKYINRLNVEYYIPYIKKNVQPVLYAPRPLWRGAIVSVNFEALNEKPSSYAFELLEKLKSVKVNKKNPYCVLDFIGYEKSSNLVYTRIRGTDSSLPKIRIPLSLIYICGEEFNSAETILSFTKKVIQDKKKLNNKFKAAKLKLFNRIILNLKRCKEFEESFNELITKKEVPLNSFKEFIQFLEEVADNY